MNNPTAPVFAPDPREAKLPVWVQEQLQSYRSTITELHDTLAGLRGEHEGSKVTLIGKHGVSQDMRLPKQSHVAFASNWGRVIVHHDLKGLVRIQGDSKLLVRPESANGLTVELEGPSW